MNSYEELALAVEAMKRREKEAKLFLGTIAAMLAVVLATIFAAVLL